MATDLVAAATAPPHPEAGSGDTPAKRRAIHEMETEVAIVCAEGGLSKILRMAALENLKAVREANRELLEEFLKSSQAQTQAMISSSENTLRTEFSKGLDKQKKGLDEVKSAVARLEGLLKSPRPLAAPRPVSDVVASSLGKDQPLSKLRDGSLTSTTERTKPSMGSSP